ncbi:cytochrome P450 [Ilyonectria robusta]|uniref:cytochrome P450 n=1 Tax=Ilyonectria robusta TaxID=1079257 RepID=UPI001E8CFC60|nr:cytochrome P450 [Ilyonectria robusta]KAH8736210.1 cytochrome P450 [Ilyonectria robusta]
MTPEVQRKAQEEMDCVTGNERLPGFLDRGNLPYIESVVKEIHRWSPIPPFGMPHLADADLVYKDHLIPKGAVLVPAVWWFLYDPEVYINPSPFSPERYLEPRNELDPMNTLAAFNISKAVDEQGLEIEAKLEATPGIVNHLADFLYNNALRNTEQAELIQAIEIELPQEESDVSLLKGATIDAYSDVLH